MVRRESESYGRWTVKWANQSHSSNNEWWIEGRRGGEVFMGTGSDAKKRARTLAAVLEKANVFDLDVLPPEWSGDESMSTVGREGWEKWSVENLTVPARVARASKASMAGYLWAVYRRNPGAVSNALNVSEGTVRQYLSDLREGRR